jgi:hypothetical protein
MGQYLSAMKRWIFFLLAILLGVAAGLFYGWVVNPVDYVDTSPDTLRIDYLADYVLMTAESFQVDQNLDLARQRLAVFGLRPAEDIVNQGIQFADEFGYHPADILLMRALATALAPTPIQSTPQEGTTP